MRCVENDFTGSKGAEEEKEKLEGELCQTQRLEAIGTLAGGIAHDFNNILTPIIGYAELAISKLPQTHPIRFGQEQILIAALRAKELVKQILAFGRPNGDERQRPVEISPIVKEALKLLRASLPSSIAISSRVEACVINADPTQIHQILMNLCTNAAHAMGDKGVLEVGLRRVALTQSELINQAIIYLKPGPHLKLWVSDTGVGMDGQTLERIFDPYFTTKELGKGSGLGLAVVSGIVKRHHGAIAVKSSPGKGSTFSIYIPAMEKSETENSEDRGSLPKGTERILFIDDEQIVLKLGAAMLEGLGYGVKAEADSMHAYELFRANPDEFDVVITDCTMPKLTGLELALEIRKIRPDFPIVLCTGLCEPITEDSAKELRVELLLKPYTIRQLSEAVRTAIEKNKEPCEK